MHEHTCVYIWIRLGKSIYSIRNVNVLPDFDISIILSLFGHFVFFSRNYGEKKVKTFLENHNRLYRRVEFTRESNKESIPFWDLDFNLLQMKLKT